MQYIFMGLGALLAVVAIMGLVVAVWYRRVVPTNMVHIVQSAKATVAYGRGKTSGNTYYAWPSCVPALGITVTEFPESIFQVSLVDYEAYDQARLPFTIDAVAFFRVSDAAVAAQRVASFGELKNQLQAVLQGAVRRILATNALEDIMQSRSELGDQFTTEVKEQISEWGVLPVKTIEFMDLRDSPKSMVIANIMAKEQSRIEKESRVRGAEIDRDVAVVKAEQDKKVKVVNAEAEKEALVVSAEGDKQSRTVRAEGDLQAALKDAEGIRARGEANASAEQAMLMNLQFYLNAAQQHGEDSEPDHEVGDLQDLLRAMWSLLTPEQRTAFAKHEDVHTVLEGACVDFDEELNKL